ncbi:MAG: hypothetical protein EXS35_09730 [Pedosphaera sp.]|nr:hypothetical protein [Pedosphaera sp.]
MAELIRLEKVSAMNRPQTFLRLTALLLGAFALVNLRAGAAETPTAQAGWAEVDITPPLGIGLGGRGGPETTAKKILDPLFAQVLFLKDAKGAGFVLVSFDVVGLPPSLSDRLRTRIVHELGLDYNLVVLNASHTHSGPYMIREMMAGVGPAPEIEVEYFKTLTDKIISATRAAGKNLKPVTVETFRGTSQVAINRRGKNKAGKVGLLPNPNGPINEEVWVLKVSPTDGSAPALVFSYACHPVIVYGFAGAAISADFPGVTRNILREKLGAAQVQFVQGTAGNVRPRVTANLENNTFRSGGATNLFLAGKQLADDILAAMKPLSQPSATVSPSDGERGAKSSGKKLVLNLAAAADRPFFLRGNPPPREIYETMAKDAQSEFRRAVAAYWLARYDSGEGFAKGDPWPVGLVRLADDEWICCFAGEPCVEWSQKVKQWLGGRNVFVWGYSQQGLTYLPTEALLPEGGYEVDECNYARAQSPARFAPGIEDAVRRSLRRQLAFVEARDK